MAKQGGLGQYFFAGGYDLSGDVAAISRANGTRGVLDNKQGLSSSAVERVLAHGDGHLEFGVHWNSATDQEHDVLSALPTTNILTSWHLGGAIGDPVFNVRGKQLNFDWQRSQDGDIQGSVAVDADGAPAEWGESLTAGPDTHASAGSNASLDGAAQSTHGARGYLHHLGRDSGTATYLIEDSPDNSVWSTLLTFAASGGATPASERKTVTGTVERYTRATTTGTFTNAAFAMSLQRGDAADLEDLS